MTPVARAEAKLRSLYTAYVVTEDAEEVLAAALTDPADPDWLARTLFGLHTSGGGLPEDEEVLAAWNVHGERTHAFWRAVADGFRATILGEQ